MKKRGKQVSSRGWKKLPADSSSPTAPAPTRASLSKPAVAKSADYSVVLSDMKQMIASSRHRALSFVNHELVSLYWNIGRVIVQQQETANWGDAVVEQLATDLRMAFPDMKGTDEGEFVSDTEVLLGEQRD